jgi:phenylalanyl-tRNA synthetase alpha chain
MKNRINELLDEVSRMAAANAEELEALRIKYLTKRGLFLNFSMISETVGQ